MGKVKISKEKYDDSPSSEAHYPYGTNLSFEDDLVDKLKLDDLDIGDTVEVRAMAKVTAKSEHDSERHSSKSVSLQLTEVDVQPEDTRDNADKLYPKDES